MAMLSVYGVVATTPSKATLRQWDGASSSLPSQSELFQCRGCANSTFSSSSASASGAWEVLTVCRRGLRKHGNVFGEIRRRRRIGVQVAAAGGEGDKRREAVSLEELDKQLEIFESRETSTPRRIPLPQRILGDSADQPNSTNESSEKLQFPALSDGFFVYAGIGLLLFTAFSNVLYGIVLGPGVDRKGPYKTTVPDSPRYRVTTLQEEREAREARAAIEAQQEALAAQSREAPPP